MNIDKIILRHSSKETIHQEPKVTVTWVSDIKEDAVSLMVKRWKLYRSEVRRLTELVAHQLDGIELRSFKGHHIDHKISIWDGFKRNIPCHEIASIRNLRIIPSHENMKKGRKSYPNTC
jgi:hypothetical protein